MKRWLWWGMGVALSIVLLSAGQAHAQDVNDFDIESFDAAYHVSRDTEGRSVLKITETITASFPLFDQNHGIERALPEMYDGHTTDLKIDSVTDASGKSIHYTTRSANDNLVLRIGDPDGYVHGKQIYVITYTQRDVTRFFQDTNSDEFYWDINGTEWMQQIANVTARVTVDPALQSKLTGKTACYQGGQGSREVCRVDNDSTRELVFASTRTMKSGETVTFAVGFEPQTFAAYQQTSEEKLFAVLMTVWLVLAVTGSIVGTVAIIWMCVARSRIMRRAHGSGTIVAEYVPPKQASVLVASGVMNLTIPAMTAQLLDLAVRHYIKIYQTKEKKLLQQAEYELEIVKNIDDLREEEKGLLKDLFGSTTIGARFVMKRLQKEYALQRKLETRRKKLRAKMRGSYGLYERATKEAKRFNSIATVLLVLGIITLSPLLIVAAVVGYVCAHTLWPLTVQGVALRDYLEGLKLYIDVAEKDRLKMLQSPDGTEKVGRIDANDPRQLIKLYERVLPYAVLFGQEKQWLKQLGAYYDQGSVQPDWYAGNTVFNAVVFSSALGSFNSQTTSYSSPSSSSSGGSGGGGSSGGGGGGW